MMKAGTNSIAVLAAALVATLPAAPALALTDQQIAAINSRVIDAVEHCTFDVTSVKDLVRKIATDHAADPRDVASIASTILQSAQAVTNSPSCLFAVGEGVTRFALGYGDSDPAAVTIAQTIGQVGTEPVINACVNTAGAGTPVGLACDPPTSDVLQGSTRRTGGADFGATGENPNRDNPSPN